MIRQIIFLFSLTLISCNPSTAEKKDTYGIIQNEDNKSLVIEKLADSYLAGNFDIARDHFTPDSKHFFNDLIFDVEGIIEGYNFHSILFDDIKHNNRQIYTGYFSDGSVETFHDFNWSAKSKISGKEYNYPCHCRWVWENEKIIETTCLIDPAGLFEEISLYQNQ
ncbi:MAG: hypothetical protein ACO3GY_08885 [Flavobacteriaceae bacterium]|jgi:hypothetical protein